MHVFLNFITMQISAYQEGTKINTEVNERPFEECWYALEYNTQLISTSTNFLQPSLSLVDATLVETLM